MRGEGKEAKEIMTGGRRVEGEEWVRRYDRGRGGKGLKRSWQCGREEEMEHQGG